MKQKHEEIEEIVYEVSLNFIQSLKKSLEEEEIDIDEIVDFQEYLDRWYKEDYRYVIVEALRNYCTISNASLNEIEGDIHFFVDYYFLPDNKSVFYIGSY